MTRILGWVVNATMVAGAAALTLMMVHITVDVVAKYVFRVPMPGTITFVSNYYMVLVVFLPLAFAERRNGHISVEVLTATFPVRAQRILSIAGMLLAALVFWALAWQGGIEAGRAREVGAFEIEQGQKILTWPARYLVPIGCGLMVVTLLAKVGLGLARGAAQDHEERFF